MPRDPRYPDVPLEPFDLWDNTAWEFFQVKYKWCTRGPNCRICEAMRGRVYTFDTWVSSGVLPGFHLFCNCYLEKVSVSTPTSSLDVFGAEFPIWLDNAFVFGFDTTGYTGGAGAWVPYNRWLTRRIQEELNSGKTLKQAVAFFNEQFRKGEFFPSTLRMFDQIFEWRVHTTLKRNSSSPSGGSILSEDLSPKPKSLYPETPAQSYHWR